jgi:membrane dipeptidase
LHTFKMKKEIEKFCTDTFIWDAHAGVFPDARIDLNLLNEWREHKVDYVSINVGFDVMEWHQTLSILAAYRNWVLKHSEHFTLVSKTDDIIKAISKGKLAVTFDIEGMKALNGDIDMVSLYHGLGVRQMLFAYNLNNDAAGGCHDENIGLTRFGRSIVAEMNRVGIIIDCSHTSIQTTMDIMMETTKPVVFSHSNPDKIWQHERNIIDDQIKRCAETGGVIGLNGMGIFLGMNDIKIETILKHICYISDLVGSDHVGLGFDFSPKLDLDLDIEDILASRPDYWPHGHGYDTPGIKHAGPFQIVEIVSGLVDRGFLTNEIKGILGENFLRVASQVWQ